ncbi:SDR family oxidoreductase [Prochlorococcus sp. AH-716-K03]|nr:SDR family oxidoreductase [Prochlorococcus sp. AH-716-K03]
MNYKKNYLKKLNKLKLAFITGVTKGIGRSTAITFAKAGWDLILLSRDLEMMEILRDELSETQVKINLVKCNLSNEYEIENSIKESINKYGIPSVLINNAGSAFNGNLVEMSLKKWQEIIQINLTSVFQICSLIVPKMRKNGGLIVNVSSHASYNPFPQWGAYCVSKSALAMFTKCLREEERSNSIRACTITLGSVNTPLWDSESIKSDFDRSSMLSSNNVSNTILFIAEQPESQIIEDLTLMPSGGAF